MLQRRTQIRRQISIRDFLADGGKEAEWIDTTPARALLEEMKAEEADEKMCKRQALRLISETGQTKNPIRHVFIKLFTSSKLGLGIAAAAAGKRDSREQSQFRKSLIKSYDAESSEGFLWCPVLKDWFDKENVLAGHLFPFLHGQDVMDAIFGVAESPELFSPLNGMLVSKKVEEVFDKGFLVIVPRVPDDPTSAQISLWNSSDPKEYKMRIIDRDQARYKQRISRQIDKTWQDLDGSDVEFRNNFRPRARYVYFHYCIQMLRYAWREGRPGQSLKKQLEKAYWGTPGRHLPRNMLMAFVEEMGHEYESLLEGAMDDAAPVMDEGSEILLSAAAAQIKASSVGVIEGDDKEEDEEEEDDEEEDEEDEENDDEKEDDDDDE